MSRTGCAVMGLRKGSCCLALASVLALSGCGGGDGGPSGPAFTISPAEPGAQPETETGDAGEASARAPAILARIDAVFATTVHEETGAGERAAHDTDCSGVRCRSSGGGGTGIDVETLGWLARAPVISRSGPFEVVAGSADDAESFGVWMQHGATGVLLERMGESGGLSEVRYALASGELSRVREGQDISGTWRGRMTGVSQAGGFVGARISGDAVLTYRSTDPLSGETGDEDVVGRIDAAFTGMAELDGGRTWADVRFDDVPVRAGNVEEVEVQGVVALPPGAGPGDVPTEAEADLTFDAGVAGNRIRGAFFGPERAEVGGVFERGDLLGAFGARSASASPGPGTEEAASEVRVIDADTVVIDGTSYRLFGIDAPESRQTCRAWGRSWDCGAAAIEALRSRAAGLSCAGSGTDSFGRTIGTCSSGGIDVNAWLVSNGWALAYRQFSEDYVDEEEEARTGRRGIHRGEHVAPWDWRRGERLAGEDTFASSASGVLDVEALADRLVRGDGSGFRGYWLEESVFGLSDDRVAVSFGSWPGTNPAGIGRGVWRGFMVGRDGGSGFRIEGDAEMEVDDFAAPDVDVALTGMTDTGGGAVPDMRWEDISVAQGAFGTSGSNGSVEGRFYGAAHGEAGGVFERNGIVGAFGATRD